MTVFLRQQFSRLSCVARPALPSASPLSSRPRIRSRTLGGRLWVFAFESSLLGLRLYVSFFDIYLRVVDGLV